MGTASDFTYSPFLNRVLACAAKPSLLTQQLYMFDQTISTTIAVFRKYVLTTRVFDHQDWSNIYNCWLSRLSCAARARTLFRKGEYVKSGAAPMRRLS